MLNCKDAAAVIIAREDRRLHVNEFIGLRVHMLACRACPHFEQQIITMRKVMKAWQTNYDVGPDEDPPVNGN